MATVTRRSRTSTTTAASAAAAKPKPISVRTQRAPTNEDGKLACAKIPFIAANDAPTLSAEARKVGMKSAGTNQWVHPKDGSWAMLDANGRLQRGVKTVEFQGIPQPYVKPADPRTANKLEKLLQETPRIPASMKSYAVATIGIVSVNNAAAACAAAGFVQIGNTWIHPDGSWVRTGGAVTVGWKGYHLQQLPYQQGWL